MERMYRGLATIIAAMFTLLLVVGCMTTTPISIAVDPASGHPTAEAGGLPVQVQCSGGQPPYCISFGDGTEVTTNTGFAQHTYRAPFDNSSYRIRATCDGGSGTARVYVENEAPRFHGIFSVKGQRAEEKELVVLQVNHFVKGCRGSNCWPCENYQVFGGEDPDDDTLFYEWHIRKEGAYNEDAVFDMGGNRVDGIPTPGDYFVWFPMWQENEPLMPMGPRGLTDALIASAATAPNSLLRPMGFYRTYVITVIVSDFCGASNTFTTKWEVLEIDN